MKKILFTLFIIVIVIVVALTTHFLTFRSKVSTVIDFEEGTSLRRISQKLAQEKVIASPFLFEFFTRFKGKEKHLRAGEYEFQKGNRAIEILNKMMLGEVKLHPITIPEGFSLKDIGKLVVSKRLSTDKEWDEIIKDNKLVESIGIQAKTIEGYLFPDTYFLQKKTTANDLVSTMLTLFKKKVTPEMIRAADEKGLTLHQWVTLASLIEKETGVSKERPLIAGVFLNRLEKNMALQSDPSVIYGIKDFNGNLTRRDLERNDPYNTYTRPGLPPGPICSPGMESLTAVLNPATTDFFYFVSKGDGSHHFSKTLEEHNRAVSHYQLHRGPPPSP